MRRSRGVDNGTTSAVGSPTYARTLVSGLRHVHRPFEPADRGYKGCLNFTEGDVVMYAGGLLTTLLILGLVLLVTSLAMVIAEPRGMKAPPNRENPGDITRRLRSQGPRGRVGRGSGDRSKG